MVHIPVLLNEAIKFLQPEKGGAFIDATADGGGHTKEILKRMAPNAILVAVDRDAKAIKNLQEKFALKRRLKTVAGNFRNLKKLVSKFSKSYDGILFDLGMSSNQLEASGRGFSFQKDEPLIMTFESSPEPGQLTAAEIINTWPEEKLAEIFWKYGQERDSRRIARMIVQERKRSRILSSAQLAGLIGDFRKAKYSGINPATKVFQALRIAVNDELPALEEGLSEAWDLLIEGGRIAVISFHSLEDRIVKNFFRNKKNEGVAEILTKKPLRPAIEEIKQNPRSRSAKLRSATKLKNE
ncbi:MAG: 16S rRNA (cytosine(1402)-N(4))-methyltransferase RsmH [Candidatus Niyogibacteria bacterium]|nr:MAG: 16S rRNA (cytosine(1402)-N(4))-methyltransferase RsmH [Candidatus Niyogibacteria bacterium]